METYKITKVQIINAFKEKNITFFSQNDLKKFFDIRSRNTLKHLIMRLKKERVIEHLRRDKYLFIYSTKKPSDFAIANFLVIPSYISLESALSYYGIIDQFPYHISSLTLGKSCRYKIRDKMFTYSKIKKDYFKDFVMSDDFLIAVKKKALFDYLYFIYKGLRPVNILNELETYVKEQRVKHYLLINADQKYKAFINKHVKL